MSCLGLSGEKGGVATKLGKLAGAAGLGRAGQVRWGHVWCI